MMTQRWVVLRSKPRKEDFLAGQMQMRKMEIFNPHIRVQTENPRARKIRSYFLGYVFVHLDLEKGGAPALHYLPGAAGLVSFGGEVADVPDGLIHAIRNRVDEINDAGGELFDFLKTGATVLVHSGPFAGYEAIFDARLLGSDRVRVLLMFLKNRQMLVDLPAGQIRPKKSPRLVARKGCQRETGHKAINFRHTGDVGMAERARFPVKLLLASEFDPSRRYNPC
jgi:transcription antitermination factor NusG